MRKYYNQPSVEVTLMMPDAIILAGSPEAINISPTPGSGVEGE